jgi:Fe2+ transport system protein FeoA
MIDLVPLHCLPTGDIARVMHILGCPEQVQRVKEMGIRDGAEIEMVRGGTTCIIRTGMQTLCVRGNDLLNVLVGRGVTVRSCRNSEREERGECCASRDRTISASVCWKWA